MDPITIALGASGLIGGLAGMFRKTPQFEAPTLDTLRRQNPELYREFMETLRDARIMSDMAASRQGLSSAQQYQLSDQNSQINQQLANRGLVGSSAGTQLAADARSRASANLMQQALAERMGLMQGAQQARSNAANIFSQGTAPAMQASHMNIQSKMANDAAMNQFFSGMLGAAANMHALDKYPKQNPQQNNTAYSYNLPTPQPWNPNVYFGQSYNGYQPNYGL